MNSVNETCKKYGDIAFGEKWLLIRWCNWHFKFYIEYMHACMCVGIYIITPEMKSVFEEDNLVKEIICGKTLPQYVKEKFSVWLFELKSPSFFL